VRAGVRPASSSRLARSVPVPMTRSVAESSSCQFAGAAVRAGAAAGGGVTGAGVAGAGVAGAGVAGAGAVATGAPRDAEHAPNTRASATGTKGFIMNEAN